MVRYQGAFGRDRRPLSYVRFSAAKEQYCAPELRGQALDGLALIDTGAAQSAISHDAAYSLGLASRSTKLITGVAGEADCLLYTLDITLYSNGRDAGAQKTWPSIRVFEARFESAPDVTGLPIIGLIGTDVLSFLRLTFDGPQQTFTLEA